MIVCAFGALVLLLAAGLGFFLAPLGRSFVCLQFASTPNAFDAIVDSWSPAQLARYRAHLPLDCLFLLAYGAFGYLLSTHTAVFALLAPSVKLLAMWCLPVAAALDACENAFHGWLTTPSQSGAPRAYAFSAACSVGKWLLILCFAALVAHALLRNCVL